MTNSANEDPRRGCTSASNALPDSLCPGRFLAQAGLPDVQGEYAEQGAKIHAALAQTAQTAVTMSALTVVEREIFDACRDMEKKLVAQYFGEKHPPIVVFREERFWAKFQTPDKRLLEHSGQPDVVFRAGPRALIIEYKGLFGDIPESSRNLQLRDQAVLVRGKMITLTEIAVSVVQPNVTRSPELCVYSQEDLRRAADEMFRRVTISNTPGQPRQPGEAQCKYCRAQSNCVEYQRWAAQICPPAMLTVMEVAMEAWSPEQRAAAAAALAPASKLLDSVKDFLKESLEKDPQSVPGWGLKPGAKREAIIDPQTCLDRFIVQGGSLAAFMPCISVKKTELKNAVATATGKKGKALNTAMSEITAGIVRETVSAPSLARAEEAETKAP